MSEGHDHKDQLRGQSRKRLILVLALTATFAIAEVTVGLWSHSLALLADAVHMLSDIAGIVLALIAIWFASKPADPNKTFGYYRSEILAGFINSFMLVIMSGFILYEAWQRLESPPEVKTGPVILLACLGLGINFISMRLLAGGAESSLNVRAAYVEIMADMLGLLGVILSGLIIMFTGWHQADAVISALIALMIIPRTWMLLNECTHILMEGTPGHINLLELRTAIGETQGVVDVHDLHVWTITSNHHAMSAHVQIDDQVEATAVLSEIKTLVERRFGLDHTTIQVESAGLHEDDHEICS